MATEIPMEPTVPEGGIDCPSCGDVFFPSAKEPSCPHCGTEPLPPPKDERQVGTYGETPRAMRDAADFVQEVPDGPVL